jgi:hypothetical protein
MADRYDLAGYLWVVASCFVGALFLCARQRRTGTKLPFLPDEHDQRVCRQALIFCTYHRGTAIH